MERTIMLIATEPKGIKKGNPLDNLLGIAIEVRDQYITMRLHSSAFVSVQIINGFAFRLSWGDLMRLDLAYELTLAPIWNRMLRGDFYDCLKYKK